MYAKKYKKTKKTQEIQYADDANHPVHTNAIRNGGVVSFEHHGYNRNMNIEEIQARLDKFAKDRDWDQFHNPKNLSMALSVEVAELVEIFQWSNSDGLNEIKDLDTRRKIEEEIADIFIYLLMISRKLNLDLSQIINKKIEKNEKKYPISKSKGKSDKYDKL